MAKGPDWNDAHRANPGAVRDALTEPDIPFDDAPAQPNGKADADPFFSWQANGEAPPKHFELIPFDKIAIDTTPAYLVKGIVPRVGLRVFWGPPKCGKSFLVFDLMMHVALGWKYRDRKVRQGPVVYCALDGEDQRAQPGSLWAVVAVIRQRHGQDFTLAIKRQVEKPRLLVAGWHVVPLLVLILSHFWPLPC